jgi:Zn-dependent protease
MSEQEPKASWRLHGALFLAAVVTTSAAGLIAAGADPFSPGEWTGRVVGQALAYAAALLAIVSVHEAGHYFAARRRGVEVSPPYFLPGIGPIPGLGVIPFFGTFGAVIRMALQRLRAVDLMAVAGWGPLAGFLVVVPVVFVGVALSEPMPLPEDEALLLLGDPLLMRAATSLFHPGMQDGWDLMLHPLGLAGWVGCLLTALNLLPIGQLDGGHLLYTVTGERSETFARIAFVALAMMGILFFTGWLLLAALIFWMGVKHPPMLSDEPARGKSAWMAWVCLGIFVLTFTPSPVIMDALPQWLGIVFEKP